MQKILTVLLTATAAFVSACSASSEKSANREYVKASAKVEQAAVAFELADYKTAKELCDSAVSDVKKIITDYPESTIALKVMTDSSTRIGPVTYTDLITKITPSLAKLYNPNLEPIGLVWPIIVKSGTDNDVLIIVAALSQMAMDEGKISAETQKKIVAELVKATKDVKTISRIEQGEFAEFFKRYNQLFAANYAPINNLAPKASSKIEKPIKISDKIIFMNEAKTQASMVAYDISAIPALRSKAISARADSAQMFEAFKKLLDDALANISKINSQQIRDKAYAEMSVLFADIGMENKAIEVARKVAESKLFEGTFTKIANSAGNSENYMDAIALASRMPEGRQKNEFLSDLAAGVAKRGYFEAAFSIASTIKDSDAKDFSYARIAVAAADKNPKALTEAVAKISLDNVEAIMKISPTCYGLNSRGYNKDKNEVLYSAAALADLAALVANTDKKLCNKINNAAINELSKSKQDSLSIVALVIADNYSKIGDSPAAINFISDNLYRIQDSPLAKLCKLGAQVAKSNPEAALKAFKSAASIASGNDEIIILAWYLANSGLPRNQQVELLSDLLPKF